MNDNSGKVILSLLAGATAGVVAGLLLAPETGEDTRASLKSSATKLGGDLSKLLRQGLSRFSEEKGSQNEGETAALDQADADRALRSLKASKPKKSASGKRKAPRTDYSDATVGGLGNEDLPSTFDDFDSDYDGTGGEGRHTGNPSFGQTL